jgi:replicative DNA helicase
MATKGTKGDGERRPPYSIDAERATLGAVLLDPTRFYDADNVLKSPDAFYAEGHQAIHRAMRHLSETARPIDTVTVCEVLTNMGALETAGGYSYVSDLTSAVPISLNADYYAGIVREKHLLRKLIETARQVSNAAHSNADPAELIPKTIDDLIGLHGANGCASGDALYTAYADWYAQNRKAKNLGIKTGIHELDCTLHLGIQKDMLVIVGGRPSDGKSSLLLSILYHVARNYGPVFLADTENSKERVMQRLHNLICPVDPYLKAHRGRDWPTLQMLRDSALPDLSELASRFYVESGTLCIEEAVCAARSQVQAHPDIRLVAFDYLQDFDTREKCRTDIDRVNTCLRKIKQLKQDIGRPVVLLSQLNRDDFKDDEGPTLKHLKGSGNIEQSADVVLLLWNPGKQFEDDVNIKCRVAKQRDGPKNVVALRFVKPQTLIISPTRGRDDAPRQEELTHEPPQPPQAEEPEEECPF